MKLVLNIDYNHSLIIPDYHQSALLAILQDSALYTTEGYSSDTVYNLSDKIPEILFVKDSAVKGLEGALEDAKKKLETRNSDYYKVSNEKTQVQKELKELQDRFAALESVITDAGRPINTEVV